LNGGVDLTRSATAEQFARALEAVSRGREMGISHGGTICAVFAASLS
jgi:hypothetical protein